MTFEQTSKMEQPKNSYRVTIELKTSKPRLDQVLIEALRNQNENPTLKNITRTQFKDLFKRKKVRIKGQIATPSSSLAQGLTHIDVLLD